MSQSERSITLLCDEPGHNKLYIMCLHELDDGWVLDYAYGKVGNKLAADTYTHKPGPFYVAEAKYDGMFDQKTRRPHGKDRYHKTEDYLPHARLVRAFEGLRYSGTQSGGLSATIYGRRGQKKQTPSKVVEDAIRRAVIKTCFYCSKNAVALDPETHYAVCLDHLRHKEIAAGMVPEIDLNEVRRARPEDEPVFEFAHTYQRGGLRG